MEFTYTVGITSTTAGSTSEQSAEKLSSSLERGWSGAVSAEAKAKLGVASASAKAAAGKSENEKEERTREHTIASEIANTASVGHTTTHKTSCTPEPGQKRAGLW